MQWFISPKSLINGECRRGSWPIQELHTAVNKLFNCRQSLNQSNSNKPSLQKRDQQMFQRKLYTNYVFCVVYCLLCCVLFVVLCIVCCVSQYCVVPTIECKFVQPNSIFLFLIICMVLLEIESTKKLYNMYISVFRWG